MSFTWLLIGVLVLITPLAGLFEKKMRRSAQRAIPREKIPEETI